MRLVLGDGDSRVDLDGLNLDIAQIICVSRSVLQTSTLDEVNGSFADTIAQRILVPVNWNRYRTTGTYSFKN